MARHKQATAEAVQSTLTQEATPPVAEIIQSPASQQLEEQSKAEQPTRPLLADPFPVKTANIGGYRIHLQHSRQAGEMQISFGDGSKKDMPSDAVRDLIKSHKKQIETASGPAEVNLLHWNDHDRSWGMRIDRDAPATSRQKAEQVFNEVVELIAQERGAGQQR